MSIVKFLGSASLGMAATLLRHNSRDAASIQHISEEQAHANVINYHPAEWIIQSDQLHEYLSSHGSENQTIYIEDDRVFVPMTSVTTLQKRQFNGAGNCFGYTRYAAENPSSWWDAWRPASQCFWTGNDPAGGSEAIAWSVAIAYTETAGLSWTVAKDILSASVGFSVTETFTRTDTKTCNIPGNSVGQVWEQTKLGSAYMYSLPCFSCAFGNPGCGKKSDEGVATAPAGELYQTGCSTGKDKVQC